jgi:hypothetical protein
MALETSGTFRAALMTASNAMGATVSGKPSFHQNQNAIAIALAHAAAALASK